MAEEKKGGRFAKLRACADAQRSAAKEATALPSSPAKELAGKKPEPDRMEKVVGRPTLQKEPSESDLEKAKPTGRMRPAPKAEIKTPAAEEKAEEIAKPNNPTIQLSDKDVDDAEKEEAFRQWKSAKMSTEQRIDELWGLLYDAFHEVELTRDKQEMLNGGLKIAFSQDRKQSDEAEERVTGIMRTTDKKTLVRLDDMYKLVQDLKRFRTPYEEWRKHLARMEGFYESDRKEHDRLKEEVAELKEKLEKLPAPRKGLRGLFGK